MGKLPSQPEYVQQESCQAITLRSGKEIEKDFNKKRLVDDDEVVEIEANSGKEDVDVSSKKIDESAKKGKKEEAKPPKEDEQKVDVRTLPFP